MTTVAWDGVTLASDTQASSGDVVCSHDEQKIYRSPGDEWSVYGEKIIAIGCSGDCGAEMEIQDLLNNGITYATEFLPTFAFSCLAIVGTNRSYLITKGSGETRANISSQITPYAIGSGGLIARVAMQCGKSAPEAVKAAIDMDCYSGGRIETFTPNQPAFIVMENSNVA